MQHPPPPPGLANSNPRKRDASFLDDPLATAVAAGSPQLTSLPPPWGSAVPAQQQPHLQHHSFGFSDPHSFDALDLESYIFADPASAAAAFGTGLGSAGASNGFMPAPMGFPALASPAGAPAAPGPQDAAAAAAMALQLSQYPYQSMQQQQPQPQPHLQQYPHPLLLAARPRKAPRIHSGHVHVNNGHHFHDDHCSTSGGCVPGAGLGGLGMMPFTFPQFNGGNSTGGDLATSQRTSRTSRSAGATPAARASPGPPAAGHAWTDQSTAAAIQSLLAIPPAAASGSARAPPTRVNSVPLMLSPATTTTGPTTAAAATTGPAFLDPLLAPFHDHSHGHSHDHLGGLVVTQDDDGPCGHLECIDSADSTSSPGLALAAAAARAASKQPTPQPSAPASAAVRPTAASADDRAAVPGDDAAPAGTTPAASKPSGSRVGQRGKPPIVGIVQKTPGQYVHGNGDNLFIDAQREDGSITCISLRSSPTRCKADLIEALNWMPADVILANWRYFSVLLAKIDQSKPFKRLASEALIATAKRLRNLNPAVNTPPSALLNAPPPPPRIALPAAPTAAAAAAVVAAEGDEGPCATAIAAAPESSSSSPARPPAAPEPGMPEALLELSSAPRIETPLRQPIQSATAPTPDAASPVPPTPGPPSISGGSVLDQVLALVRDQAEALRDLGTVHRETLGEVVALRTEVAALRLAVHALQQAHAQGGGGVTIRPQDVAPSSSSSSS
ncbi:hypothetical protein H9P43_000105 [Blastocladiella emersonii ATCC 22665]|nr:hypothetical protein H9P43_000105 [Blastocladiella emersonii ATCC 22665]